MPLVSAAGMLDCVSIPQLTSVKPSDSIIMTAQVTLRFPALLM